MKPLNRGELLNRAFPMGDCIPNDAIDLIEANERAKCEAKFKQTLYELDWSKILHEAILLRQSSWPADIGNHTEWRNAGDTIMAALISRLKKQKVIT